MNRRTWTILLTGLQNGLVGPDKAAFRSHPDHYERVDVVEQELILAAYVAGYEAGHNDTVESGYTDARERAEDWLAEADY